MRVRFTIDSDWRRKYERLNIRSTKYKQIYSFDLNCFETKRNVEDLGVDVDIMKIQYNIINIDSTRG